MSDKKVRFTSIDDYIATFPEDIQTILQEIRATIHAAAPDATEKISYNMPTFVQNGSIIHFGAYAHHIGVYPAPDGSEAFTAELAQYDWSGKGTLRLPLDKPLPLDLITRIVQFRVTENLVRAELKPKKEK